MESSLRLSSFCYVLKDGKNERENQKGISTAFYSPYNLERNDYEPNNTNLDSEIELWVLSAER